MSYYDGLGFALLNAAMMTTMTTREDVGATSIQNTNDDSVVSSICMYDLFVGGLGYSEKAYDLIAVIIDNAIKMVRGCKCRAGCPACVGDYNLDKSVVLWGLENFYEESAPPEDIKIPPVPQETTIEKIFSFADLANEWNAFTEYIFTKGEYLSGFVSSIKNVRLDGPKLILLLNNDFYKTWLLESDNKIKLQNIISQYVDVPLDFDIDVEIETSEIKNIEDKLAQRFNDLTGG
ncbi:MAG: DUF1998 domain-containing protein [Fastidiosipila sp.]|nr:DUF1998 domain-containing protein [Fastidiosipila sp.]